MKKISKGIFLSVAGGIVLLLQAFGLKIDAPYANEIIDAVCAVLIVLGIVTGTSVTPDSDKSKQELSNAEYDEASESNNNTEDNETDDNTNENALGV